MSSQSPSPAWDVTAVRQDFPLLQETVNGHPLAYLDNAATTQKPTVVIDAVRDFYTHHNANIHRGIYTLSEEATAAYEAARSIVAKFIKAPSDREVIFVRGATEGINLVAQTFGRMHLQPEDTILLTALEHHANIVPWQMLAEQTGAQIKVVPMDDRGTLDLEALGRELERQPKILGIVHLSNAIGTLNPLRSIIAQAHQAGVPVLVDAAQSVPHLMVDVHDLDCDFLVFSGHKVFGPTGIGVLYGKEKYLNTMPPYQGGGDMIRSVSFAKTTYRETPERFEAGTPHIIGAIGLARALQYLDTLGRDAIRRYEEELFAYASKTLRAIDPVRPIGTAPDRHSVFAFLLKDAHLHDMATLLDQDGIAIRAGHQCAEPIMQRLGIPGVARASFCFYNTHEEVDRLAESLLKISRILTA